MRTSLVVYITATVILWAVGIAGFIAGSIPWTVVGYAAGAVTFCMARKIVVPNPLSTRYILVLDDNPGWRARDRM